MSFLHIYLNGFLLIMVIMTILWIASVFLKNVSIVDLFWGLGFVVTGAYYFLNTQGPEPRKILLIVLITLWGLRLSLYLAWRNIGKGEDFRYGQFRKHYGESRYWWISFFQTFLLQGILMWLISAPLLGSQFYGSDIPLSIFDYLGLFLWFTGFCFETIGDLQLAHFKANPANKGKVMSTGLWRYTRHPNYFGDAAVWWGFGFFCVAAGSYLPVLGSVLMTALIIKVSGVALLEKSLKDKKPEYKEYIDKTSAFIPWFPKKHHNSE
jgi:steroid 5-alpha reductase family enzyme